MAAAGGRSESYLVVDPLALARSAVAEDPRKHPPNECRGRRFDKIGAQQLNFLGNCQCNLNFWGILGYRITLLTFDNNYLLGNIHWYSITAYINVRTCETCCVVLVEC